MGSLNVQQTIAGAHPLLIWVRADWIVPSLVWSKGFKCVPGEEHFFFTPSPGVKYTIWVHRDEDNHDGNRNEHAQNDFFFEEHLGTM